ncbi:hypothetical protein Mterra_03186 [Calidithermus terrae]|uniref:Uncharacterized protein n=1 Tax=Calidithermus terrae TaxID=1408545 RepID=A0A399EBS4_9DEIN|nr:hypothetical protein Mterra_03186 [Calidithermus terrae]
MPGGFPLGGGAARAAPSPEAHASRLRSTKGGGVRGLAEL